MAMRIKILYIILALVFAGCNGTVTPTPSPQREEHVTGQVKDTVGSPDKGPDKFPIGTPTIIPTVTSLPTNTAPAFPSPRSPYATYERHCFTLSDEILKVNQAKENLVLDGSYFNQPVVILGEDNVLLRDPFSSGFNFLEVSPNRKYIAIMRTSESKGSPELQIIENGTDVVAHFDWKPNWREIVGWLNDHQLILSNKEENTNGDSSLILDVFTGETTLIPAAFPNFYPAGDLNPRYAWGAYAYTGFFLHPSLQYVVYVSDRKNPGLVLVHIPDGFQFERGESYEVAYAPGGSGYYLTWSPNGDYLAFFNKKPELPASDREQRELFLIDLDGKIDQLTNFNPDRHSVSMKELSWSPDRKRIAFLMRKLEDETYLETYPDVRNPYRLVILDISSGIVTDTCVPGDRKPIWSVDGNYLTVTHVYESSEVNKGHLYLVDIVNQTSYNIIDDYFPEAWIELSK